MSVLCEVWGDYACFSMPAMKAERYSYSMMTPSAARGILEACYWHPGMRWRIDRIYVCNPIRFTNLRRNEVADKILCTDLLSTMNNGGPPPHIAVSESIQQRAATMLRDVRYVIEAHFDMTERANASDNPGKFQDSIKRRLKKGACYSQPYLGCRECTAHFRLWEGGEIPLAYPREERDLGLMLYDMDYSDPQEIRPLFFRAMLRDSVLDLRDCEVFG